MEQETMISDKYTPLLERKFCTGDTPLRVIEGNEIAGYASLFGAPDQGGDTVAAGAYGSSLAALKEKGRTVKMLWQHDPTEPIGVWDAVIEDDCGLYVRGRLLTDVARGAEALSLINAGAIDGLSIGYRTKRAERGGDGGRVLHELELWEVSLVTFPMLPEARVDAKAENTLEFPQILDPFLSEIAEAIEEARRDLAEG